MHPTARKIPFLLFFVSGFCGLLYQVVWIRLAFRSFGVITPVLSVVISVFMLGLALGSWWGGKWVGRLSERTGRSPLIFYAVAELGIGVGAFAVPWLYSLSEGLLLSLGEMDSFGYLAFSALLIVVDILPWCVLMGFTFPLMMAYLKGMDRSEKTGFSLLYLANVIGAMTGTLVTAFVLIELLGFSNTLMVAAFLNFGIAAASFMLNSVHPLPGTITGAVPGEDTSETGEAPAISTFKNISTFENIPAYERPALFTWILFLTGFIAMALEVVWIRAFTTILYTTVYAFAALLSVYLLATLLGSYLYRRHASGARVYSNATLFGLLAVFAFLPIILNDPRINTDKFVLLSTIMPLCLVLGYLTPKLIDLYSSGFPESAGRAYALNILGCIVGPVFASYVLLPQLGARVSMVVLSIPFIVMYFVYWKGSPQGLGARVVNASMAVVFFSSSLFINVGHEELFKGVDLTRDAVIRRDHTATVSSFGKGMQKRLLVNGIGMTTLTPITKMMAHLPLAFLKRPPDSALVICFGMGTTFRSLLSWPIEATAVELVPSVKEAFGYYHRDAQAHLDDPRGRIIIDDGRRFLMRTRETFDVITVDPPPPITAAGSGFLYSRDFLEVVKLRLAEGGIMHHWIPGGDRKTVISVHRALTDAFPYVWIFPSIEDWGLHYLASMDPIEIPTAAELAERMPVTAKRDMLEWNRRTSVEQMFGIMLSKRIYGTTLFMNEVDMLTDDRPVNEYFILRKFFGKDWAVNTEP